MHPEFIKAHIRANGSSAAQIARAAGVSEAAVCYVIRGQRRSARLAVEICLASGLDADTAFPGQYPLLNAAVQQRPNPHQEAA